MAHRAAMAGLSLLGILLSACNSSTYLGDLAQPAPMDGPKGTAIPVTAQDTPELEKRAIEEREALPMPPDPPPADNYFGLGLVPLDRPKMPTAAEIAGATKQLQDEQDRQAAVIAAQAGAPPPGVLPKPTTNTTPPAGESVDQPATASSEDRPLSGASPMEGEEASVYSQDHQIFLPQSQTVESPDFLSPSQR
jgi:hypothetical protein